MRVSVPVVSCGGSGLAMTVSGTVRGQETKHSLQEKAQRLAGKAYTAGMQNIACEHVLSNGLEEL